MYQSLKQITDAKQAVGQDVDRETRLGVVLDEELTQHVLVRLPLKVGRLCVRVHACVFSREEKSHTKNK